MCDLTTKSSTNSSVSRNEVTASGVFYSTHGKGDDRRAGDKGHKQMSW